MRDLFKERKQAFRKVSWLSALCAQWPLCLVFLLVLGLSSLPVQSTLTTYFPENHWPILVCVGITCFTFTLWGNCHLYMEFTQAFFLSWRRGNQAPSQASNWHFPSLLALCTDPFLSVICAFIFSNGLWLASFSALCAFIGGRKIFPLSRQKASKFFTNWTGLGLYVISQKQV